MNVTSETLPDRLVPVNESPINTYARLDWKLIPVPAGTKGSRKAGWNRIENCHMPDNWSGNVGLALAYSGIVSLDIDHWLKAARWLADRGIDLDVLYQAPGAVKINSGKQGRGKLLYKLPEGLSPLVSQKITIDRECILEFRCATSNGLTVQDLIVPSIHPETQQPYRWLKPDHVDLFEWLNGMQEIPADLLKVWQDRASPREPVIANPDLSADWEQVKEALGYISADCSRDEWIRVGMGLHDAGTRSGDSETAFHIWDDWSSQSPEKYKGQRDLVTQWRSFKPDNGVTLGTLFKLAKDAGWTRPPPDPAALFAGVQASTSETPSSPPASLDQFAMNGESAALRAKMLTDVFLMGRLVVLGQSTVIFAKPNCGKTLLTLWLIIEAINDGRIEDPSRVYYINTDDSHKGFTKKLELAKKHGFRMLGPGYKGFTAPLLVSVITQMVERDTARGVVVILDTFKKFANLMNKDKASEFNQIIRQLVQAGGTAILLAHVNKHRGDDGKVVHAGTSDSVDDSDCAYLLDVVSEDASGMRTVKFENIKSRGDVEQEAFYQYNASSDAR